MLLYFASLPVIWAREQWNYPLPNPANMSFNFYYFLIFTMLLYIPRELIRSTGVQFIWCIILYTVFPQLYGHMIKQRKKVIGGEVPMDATKKTNWKFLGLGR